MDLDEATASPADAAPTITVQVVSSQGPRQVVMRSLQLPQGITLGEAIRALQAQLGETMRGFTVALWGHQRPHAWRLQEGDRIELLRPLQVEPMESRRRRQALQKERTLRPSDTKRGSAKQAAKSPRDATVTTKRPR